MLQGIDVLDQTPVIDSKPYVADFDQCNADRFGWFEGKSGNATHQRSDERFAVLPATIRTEHGAFHFEHLLEERIWE